MHTHRSVILGIAVAVALVATACGGSPTAGGGTTDNDTAAGDGYAELQELSHDQLVERAEDEGRLDLYTSMTEEIAEVVTARFEKTYDVQVEVYRASSETVLQRVLQEQEARFAGNDVLESNLSEMVVVDQEGLFEPYKGAARQDVQETGRFPGWTATRFNLFAPSWNTRLVPEGQQPTSWEDLADPRWEGKISMEVDDVDWFLTLWGYWRDQGKSDQEIERLFRAMARNAKVVKGHTVQGELLSAGQFAVAVSNYTYLVQQVIDKGAPVAYEPLVEPVIARPNGIGLMKTAKHPAAALLFTEWLLTDGQDVLMEHSITPAVAGMDTALADVELIPVDADTLLAEGKQWADRYQRILAEGEEVEGAGG